MTRLTIWNDPLISAFFWSGLTIGFYLGVKALYRRWPFWWLAPLAVTPLVLILAAIALHTSYRDYIRGTQWLVSLLGPTTVAFAVPIYEQARLGPSILAGARPRNAGGKRDISVVIVGPRYIAWPE